MFWAVERIVSSQKIQRANRTSCSLATFDILSGAPLEANIKFFAKRVYNVYTDIPLI